MSTLAAAGVGLDGGRKWPPRPPGSPESAPRHAESDPLSAPTIVLPVIRAAAPFSSAATGVLLVVRASASGLQQATRAAAALHNGQVPAWVEVAGLVVVTAAPGRTPRVVRERLRLVAGWMPAVWTVPWVRELTATDTELVKYCAPFKAAIPSDIYKLRDKGTAK